MCSLQPTGDPVKDSFDTLTANRLCVKCKQAPATISIRFAVYCDACFLEQAFHKYRSNVAKSRKRAERENILLFMDLDYKIKASFALLMMATQTLSDDAHRLYADKFFVAFFREDQTLARICSESNIRLHIIPEPEECSRLGNYKCTASDDLISAYNLKAVANIAKDLGCDKVYFPDSCNDVAASVFKLTIKGLGEIVPWEIQTVKTLFTMNIVKPLRDHSNIELAEFLRLKNVVVKDDHCASFGLNDLTHKFLSTLDKDYSATVSTVVRTAGKVSSKWCDHTDLYHHCPLCGQPTMKEADNLDKLCPSCSTNLNELKTFNYSKQ